MAKRTLDFECYGCRAMVHHDLAKGQFEKSHQSVILSVADTGKGMTPEVRDSLFTSSAISTKPGGTGLGTKIVKDVVTAHGGSISLESKEGFGTTIYIRLPIDPTKVSTF